MMDHDHDDNYYMRSKALDKAETAGSLKAVEEMLQGAHLVLGFYTGAKPAAVEQATDTATDTATAFSDDVQPAPAATVSEPAMVAMDYAEPVNRKERKPRGPNKLKAAKGKRGKPAKAKAADTGDAPGDAPETSPAANGAMPHVETTQQVEQPDMAA